MLYLVIRAGFSVQAELLHFVAQGVARDLEQPRRLGLVASGALERLDHKPTLLLSERHATRVAVDRNHGLSTHGRNSEIVRRLLATLHGDRKTRGLDISRVFQNHGTLNGVPQFTHIAWPIVCQQKT